jgi:hypothetical protein
MASGAFPAEPGRAGGWLNAGDAAVRRRGGAEPGRELAAGLAAGAAACDAASGPHLILIGALIAGPCCALLTARWALTAAASGFALALRGLLGVPDQIFATVTQYGFLAAVAAVGAAATIGAAVLQRRHP